MRRPKVVHEVRCGIHGFIHFNNLERALIDSGPMQRLKHIHQLAMTYQVYPGATHRRFEHSLGVMELAGRAFDSIIEDAKKEYGALSMREATDEGERDYWRQVIRLAALLHDVGHLPFSHAAEKQLLPEGWSHETLTKELILGSEIADILKRFRPAVHAEDVVKLALEPEEQEGTDLTPWEALLNELITGPTFGVDRMDYLLRDSHHAGVPYGHFDPLRLVDSLVILQPPEPPTPAQEEPTPEAGAEARDDAEPESALEFAASGEQRRIGVQIGGIHGVEALLVARYFMYTQLYFHDVRRAYDAHLIDFLKVMFAGRSYPVDLASHLSTTDNEVLAAIRIAAMDPQHPGHDPARRIQSRDHFRTAYEFKRADYVPERGGTQVVKEVGAALAKSFGAINVKVDSYFPKPSNDEVYVLTNGGEVVSGRAEFELLAGIPNAWFAYVLCDAQLLERVSEAVAGMVN